MFNYLFLVKAVSAEKEFFPGQTRVLLTMMSWRGQCQQHDQNLPSSCGSSIAIITEPKRSMRRTGCLLLAGVFLLLATRPGDALVNPMRQVKMA